MTSYDVKSNKNVEQVLGYLLKYILLYLNRTKTQRGVPFIPSPLPLCSAVGGGGWGESLFVLPRIKPNRRGNASKGRMPNEYDQEERENSHLEEYKNIKETK